jgi:hypothetical protein
MARIVVFGGGFSRDPDPLLDEWLAETPSTPGRLG